MRTYDYLICDVFTGQRFGGNPLAVLPLAEGLDTSEMQQIAREFNFSESTFVTPGAGPNERQVRIFTPTTEVPFAGHPNVGTAFALAQLDAFGDIGDGLTVTFQEGAGPVVIDIARDDEGRIRCEIEAPQALSVESVVAAETAAAALTLEASDIRTSVHEPCVAGVGLPFLLVELASREALGRARGNIAVMEALKADGVTPDVHAYFRSNDDFDIRARMFAPLDGVPEDPATGSANCALAALLTARDSQYEGGGAWRIAQGVEMRRPSVLDARTRVESDRVRTFIAGNTVLVSSGVLLLD